MSPSQLYGIEINAYAHDLAQMTVWILTDRSLIRNSCKMLSASLFALQWIRANGFGFPADPILKPLTDNIRRMDAILAPDGSEPDWPNVDYIIGNPPFLGGKFMRRELGDDNVDRLFVLWRDRVRPEADLCCYWFEKARAHIAAGHCRRAGLLATQGIRGGANREVLKRIKAGGGLFWAESDRPWVLDGANVHVSMIGFDDGTDATRTLDGKPVSTINANLTAAADTTRAEPLAANRNTCFMGTTKGGPFDVSQEQALSWLRLPNPHGRPSSDVVVPWVNGKDLNQRPSNTWIIDFGVEMAEGEATRYETVFAYVRDKVKPQRDKSRSTIVEWWLHERRREEMRIALAPLPRFLCTCRVAKHRLFVWLAVPTVPDSATFAFGRSDDLFFGLLHCRVHEVWALAQGTQLREKESGFRYTPTTCFETFPLPDADAEHDGAIAAAAKELNELREGWLNPPDWTRPEILEFPGTVGGRWDRYIDPATVTDRGDFKVGTVRYPRLVPKDAECAARLKKRTLTNLYNERPAWLADCHARLDAAVAAAYGWPADLSDEAILERLLSLNQERS